MPQTVFAGLRNWPVQDITGNRPQVQGGPTSTVASPRRAVSAASDHDSCSDLPKLLRLKLQLPSSPMNSPEQVQPTP